MIVSELIEKLSKFDSDAEVILSFNDHIGDPYEVDLCWHNDYDTRGLVSEVPEDPDEHEFDKQAVFLIHY